MPIFSMNRQSVFRSFREHKALKAEEQRQEEALHLHQRKPSEASSVASTSSDASQPSIYQTDRSSDWDPLRLHPPLGRARPPCIPPAHTPVRYRYEDDDSSHASSHHQHTRSYRELQAQSGSSTEIHGGFDFGFKNGLESRPEADGRDPGATWPSPTRRDRGGSDSQSPGSETTPTEWGEAVTPRRRPPGHDEADYFMRRGGWKRQGVVFAPGVLIAGEDETFDFP